MVEPRRAPLCWELRCRFVVAVVWILGIGLLQNVSSLGILMLFTALLLPLIGVPVQRIVRRLFYVTPFLMTSFFTLLISDGFPITPNAFGFAGLIVVRILACLLVV